MQLDNLKDLKPINYKQQFRFNKIRVIRVICLN